MKTWKELIELKDRALKVREVARQQKSEYRDSIAWMTWNEAAKEVANGLQNAVDFTLDYEHVYKMSGYATSLNDIRKIRDILICLNLMLDYEGTK